METRVEASDQVVNSGKSPDECKGFRVPNCNRFWLNSVRQASAVRQCQEARCPDASHEVQFVTIHGHRRAFVKAGTGPVVLLLHGLGCDHTTWEPVIDTLARRYTVIAPDLLGHGQSDKPRADYSVGGYANGMRDLLTVLGHRQGHRGRAQLRRRRGDAVRLPVPRAHRAAGAGRLRRPRPRGDARRSGRSPRPGFHQVMGVLTLPGVRHVGDGRPAGAVAAPAAKRTRDLDEVADDLSTRSATPAPGTAIRHVVRAVVDWRGQIVTMADRAYLTEAMPMCVIWGRDDRVIPVGHANNAAAARAEGPGRGDPERRPLPAQGPPAAVRQDRRTSSSARPSPRRTRRARWRAPAQGRRRRPGSTRSVTSISGA